MKNVKDVNVQKIDHPCDGAFFFLRLGLPPPWARRSTYSRSIASSKSLTSSTVKGRNRLALFGGSLSTRNPFTSFSREALGSLRWMISSIAALVEVPFARLNRSTIWLAAADRVIVVRRATAVEYLRPVTPESSRSDFFEAARFILTIMMLLKPWICKLSNEYADDKFLHLLAGP